MYLARTTPISPIPADPFLDLNKRQTHDSKMDLGQNQNIAYNFHIIFAVPSLPTNTRFCKFVIDSLTASFCSTERIVCIPLIEWHNINNLDSFRNNAKGQNGMTEFD